MTCKQTKICNKCDKNITLNNFIRHSVTCDGRKVSNTHNRAASNRGGWNRGITLRSMVDSGRITEEELNRRLAILRENGRNSSGIPTDPNAQEKRREVLRENAIRRGLGGHTSKRRLYFRKRDGSEVYLQSSYEIKLAMLLEEHNIIWDRPPPLMWTDENNIQHRYYPDFRIGSVYVDTKNDYLITKDEAKINAVRQQNNVTLLVIGKDQINDQFILQHCNI